MKNTINLIHAHSGSYCLNKNAVLFPPCSLLLAPSLFVYGTAHTHSLGFLADGRSHSLAYNNLNLVRSFSSEEKKDNRLKNINTLFKDNQVNISLPPLDYDEYGKRRGYYGNHDFSTSLGNILNSLDKSYFYELKILLFLHTNDKDKEKDLTVIAPSESGTDLPKLSESESESDSESDSKPESESKSDSDSEFDYEYYYKSEKMNMNMGMYVLYSIYKYKGYYEFYADVLDFNMVKDLTEYVRDVERLLENEIRNINRSLDGDSFIEYNKKYLLKLCRLGYDYPRQQGGFPSWLGNKSASGVFGGNQKRSFSSSSLPFGLMKE